MRAWSKWRGKGRASGRDGGDRRARAWSRPGNTPNWWNPTSNVKWRVPVPGEGNSSPIVWGDRIFLTTAHDRGARQSLIAFQRGDGRKLWETFLPQSECREGAPEERACVSDARD